ncbi:MAG: 3-dehydroquinate synthase family protein [Planctomycetota bacterium]
MGDRTHDFTRTSTTRTLVGRGVATRLREIVDSLEPDGVFLVHDRLLGDAAHEVALATGARAAFAIEGGEATKTIEHAIELVRTLSHGGATRGSVVVALGGGTVCDLVGFVAAIHLRGVRCVLCPTTMLAACDAALGGKNGVDLDGLKNAVGTIRQPEAVVADTRWLATLSDEAFREGLAEVVKKAAVLDAALFARLEELAPALVAREDGAVDEVVDAAVATKMAVVDHDELEGDRRRWLNFGHTIGHALESASGMTLPHGRAVAIGMVAECRAAGSPAEPRLARLLAALRLPTEVPAGLDDVDRLHALVAKDKKARSGAVPMVVPAEIGRGELVELTRDRLRRALSTDGSR